MEEQKNKIGRVTKLTEEVIADMVAAIGAGISRKRAAYVAGISESTLYSWIKQAKTGL